MPTLNWIGKEKVVNHHLDVPSRVLEHKYGFRGDSPDTSETGSGNIIIHGDNLEALKALLPLYEGRIDCVYIDPPYNTGKEKWVYNDNVNDSHIKKWLGEVGIEGEDLCRHDKWLCMMYPRLQLLARLMSKDASMAISIGYHELHSLIYLCKEIFSSKQIIPVTVQTSGGKPAGGFNYLHEYVIFIVSKEFNPNALDFCGGNPRRPFEGLTLSTFNKENRANQTYPIFIDPKTESLVGVGKSLQELIDEGLYTGEKKDFIYDFSVAPEGTIAIWPITTKNKECVWRQIPSRIKSDWEKGYIKVTKNNHKEHPNQYSIQYLPEGIIKKIKNGTLEVVGKENNKPTLILGSNTTEGSSVPTIWLEKNFYTVKGTQTLKEIFPEEDKPFDYPKSPILIRTILQAISKENDIILDSFAGSGTTAHAILDINNQDEGDRKFILIEMMDYAKNLTAERVRRVIKGYGEGDKHVPGTGGSFDYYELGVKLFNEDGTFNPEAPLESIKQYIWYSETKKPYSSPSDNHPYYIGNNDGAAYFLCYDKNNKTTLSIDNLDFIKEKAEMYIIYADICLLEKSFMDENRIIFKKIPRDITKF